MPSHKFKVGEIVALKPAFRRNVPGGTYEVIRQLPRDDDGEFRYRIKSANETHERVAREGELTRLDSGNSYWPAMMRLDQMLRRGRAKGGRKSSGWAGEAAN